MMHSTWVTVHEEKGHNIIELHKPHSADDVQALANELLAVAQTTTRDVLVNMINVHVLDEQLINSLEAFVREIQSRTKVCAFYALSPQAEEALSQKADTLERYNLGDKELAMRYLGIK